MSRTKGSVNKPKNTTLKVLNFDRYVEGSPITKVSSFGWVNYGLKNNMPELLLDLYNQSPTHHSAIDFGTQSIVGNGIDYEAMQMDSTQLYPNYFESWDSVLRNIALDYELFGSFALQIIRNKDGKTYSFWHMPLHKVRWSEYDEDGQIPFYYVCSDWSKVSQLGAKKLRAFDMQTEIKSGEPYLYVYRQYTPTQDYYTSPHYIAALKAIQAEVEYLNFDLKTTVNSFVPSGLLVLPDQSDDEARQTIIKEVSKMFQGSDNANSLLITFKNNVDESRPEYIPFSTNNGNVNLYDSANTRTQSRILSAHQIPCASLCGLPDIGATGFASDSQKLKTAYDLYNRLIGNYNRSVIVGAINFMLKMNGIDVELVLKPLTFDTEEEVKVTDTNTNSEINDAPEGESEIEERVE